MQFPEKTPKVVRQAVTLYARRCRLIEVLTVLAFGAALIGLTVAGFMVLDRLAEVSTDWRALGPLLCRVWVVLTIAGLVRAFMRRYESRAIAIRLDQALRQNEDRWATALDLAGREAADELVANDLVKRLYADTDSKTRAADAGSVVSMVWLKRAMPLFLVVAVLIGGMAGHPFFDMNLLWQRFQAPDANLPRDGMTRIEIVEVNGSAPPPIASVGRQAIQLAKVPEFDALSIKVRLSSRQKGVEELPTPRLELLKDGKITPIDLVRVGSNWLFTYPEMTAPLTFQIRAGDGLTRRYEVAVENRIRIVSFKHSIRYPSYTRLPAVKDQELAADRLSLLEGTKLDFALTFDRKAKSIEASLELLAGKKEEGRVDAKKAWAAEKGRNPNAKKENVDKHRKLRVKLRRNGIATFRHRLDESGILRIRVIGENGLAGRERVIVLEALRDAPPRIRVTGVAPDSYIVPGELVGYKYQVEDDLAVADLFMEWTAAGSARTGDLYGEEYIRSEQLGQPVVQGEDMIQRMNYRVYGTVPFEFTLIAVDSKGQEVRSESHRIHLLRDTHAARFAAGMKLLTDVRNISHNYRNRLNILNNLLNVMNAAVANNKNWPQGQEKQLEQFDKESRRMHIEPRYGRQRLYFGGFPQRLSRALALLFATTRAPDTAPDYMALTPALRDPGKAAATITALQKTLAAEMKLLDAVLLAADEERSRFAAEAVMQEVRGVRLRVARLADSGSQSLKVANLKVYRESLQKLLPKLRELKGGLETKLAADLEGADAVAEEGDIPAILALLSKLESTLTNHAPPMSAGLTAALQLVNERAKGRPELQTRLSASIPEAVSAREPEAQSTPILDRELLRAAATKKLAANWFAPAVSEAEVSTLLQRLLAQWSRYGENQRLGRYQADPTAADEIIAALREESLLIVDLLGVDGGLPAAQKDSLRNVLSKPINGDLSAGAHQAVAAVAAKLQAAATASVDKTSAEFAAALKILANQSKAIAARYEAYAKRVAADEAEGSREAQELQAEVKGIEIAYRGLMHDRMLGTLGKDSGRGDWVQWQPLHALQLLLLIDSQHAFEKVTFQFTKRNSKRSVIIANTEKFAARMKARATDIERLAAGKAIVSDVVDMMRITRTTGHLETVEQEYGIVRALLNPAHPKHKQTIADVRESDLGSIVEAELLLTHMLALQQATGQQKAAEIPKLIDQIDSFAVTMFEQELETLRAELPIEGALTPRRMKNLDTAVGSVIESLRSRVKLPTINLRNRNNVRGQSASASAYWPIRGVVDDFDRRWVYRMRDAQLSLVRNMLLLARQNNDAASSRLIGSYAKVVELRARQVAHERRRNSGISYLQNDEGPALNLPVHIAKEFMRARNRRPPAQFKEQTETYFQQMYRDLSP